MIDFISRKHALNDLHTQDPVSSDCEDLSNQSQHLSGTRTYPPQRYPTMSPRLPFLASFFNCCISTASFIPQPLLVAQPQLLPQVISNITADTPICVLEPCFKTLDNRLGVTQMHVMTSSVYHDQPLPSPCDQPSAQE